MKIGIDIRLLGNRHGGIGRYVFELVTHMLEQDNTNEYVLFFNENASDEKDLREFDRFTNAELIPTGSRHYSLSEQTKFLRMLNKYNCDLVHFPNFNAPLLYNKPFVVTIHDVVHHKISGQKKSHLLHFFAYKKVIEHAVTRAEQIITVSEYSKKDISKYFNVSPQKINVIYEGPSLPVPISPIRVAEVRKKFLLTRPYFLFVGVLERKKNVINLTRGFDLFLKNSKLDMDLCIAGKVDPHYPDIKYEAMDIKHRDRLVFTGYVEDEDLAALYQGAHAFVSASLHEGFGLPGVEAMQYGLPLAVSNITVFNEIYENAAIYFDPLEVKDIAEKMHLIARDNLFHQQLQQKSLQRGTEFDWKKTAHSTLNVYRNVLKKI